MIKRVPIFILLILVLIGLSCQNATDTPTEPAFSTPGNDDNPGGGDNGNTDPGDDSGGSNPGGNNDSSGVFITDQRGKRWDITHAVDVYGFKAEDFQFGIGANVIKPILEPKFYKAGDPDFPTPHETFLVLGTTIHDDSRAYAISDMSRHEVADDMFDSTYVAVAY